MTIDRGAGKKRRIYYEKGSNDGAVLKVAYIDKSVEGVYRYVH